MARQIGPVIDLRSQRDRQGISQSEHTIAAISNILKTIGQAEQLRRERQQLDRVTRAISNGATTAEAIKAAANEPTGFGGGLQGVLQKIGGVFQPSQGGGIGRNIQEAIVGNALQQSFAPKSHLTSAEQTKAARIEAGLEPRATTTKKIEPFELTDEEKQESKQLKALKRDRNILSAVHTTGPNKGKLKATPSQQDAARRRIDANQSTPKNPIHKDADYTKLLQDELKEDGLFGEKAYERALQSAEDISRLGGLDASQVKENLKKWWDAKVKDERTGGSVLSTVLGATSIAGLALKSSGLLKGAKKNTLVPREEFKGEGKKKVVSDDDARLQSAPDIRLDPIWDRFSKEDKKKILSDIDNNPEAEETIVANILARVQSAGTN